MLLGFGPQIRFKEESVNHEGQLDQNKIQNLTKIELFSAMAMMGIIAKGRSIVSEADIRDLAETANMCGRALFDFLNEPEDA